MSEPVRTLISRCLGNVLDSHLALGFDLFLYCQACRLKPSKLPSLVISFELRLLLNLLCTEVMDVFYGQTQWYPVLEAVYSLVHILLLFLILAWHFEGYLIKNILVACWLEVFVMGCLMGAWALAYWGTGEYYMMTGDPLSPRDALMILFYIPLCAVCYVVLKPVLRFCRNYEFKHSWRWLYLLLPALMERTYISICTFLPDSSYQMAVDLALCTLVVGVAGIALMKRARRKKRIYAQQQRFMETHLGLLREQAAWVMDSRTHLEEQIAVVESLPPGEQDTLAQSYLMELKEQYHTFLEGIRCKDPLVDALLRHQEIICRQQGITAEFSTEQYDRGSMTEQEVVVLLMLLLDGAVHSCLKSKELRRISLTMAQLKGQLLVELRHSGKQKLSRDGFRPVLRRHDGVFWQKREGDGWRVEVLLETR